MHKEVHKPHGYLRNVIVEHLGNAGQLLEKNYVSHFRHRSCDSFDVSCRRCEANLDALRIAGTDAVDFGQVNMQDDGEVASVIALLLAEGDGNQSGAFEESVNLLRHESPEIRQSAWWGLRLASSRNIEPHLRALLGKPKWDFASAAALDILAFHRLPVQAEIGGLPDEEGDEIAWLLAEAGGRMRGAWKATHLKQFLGHASSRVREAALRASARCGLLELPAFCREATLNSVPLEAFEFLGVVGSFEDIELLRAAAGNPVTAEAALGGLGRLGLVKCVPLLLEAMSSPDLSEAAAQAFWRITGIEVPRSPDAGPPDDLTEDELDFWEPHAPVNVTGAKEWWEIHFSSFDPDKRYQVGMAVTDDPLGEVFDQLPLGIRYDVYLRERALTPGTPDWELETWTWRQKSPTF